MRIKFHNTFLGLLMSVFIGLQPVERLSIESHNPDESVNSSRNYNKDIVKLGCKICLVFTVIAAGMVAVAKLRPGHGDINVFNTTENRSACELANLTNSSPASHSSRHLYKQNKAVKHK